MEKRRKKIFLVMKQLVFLLCAFQLNVFSGVRAQQVSEFKVQDANLKECIQKVEQLTGLGFMYNGTDLEQVKGINLEMRNVEVEALLDALLEGAGYTYRLVNGVIAISKAKALPTPEPQVKERVLKGVVKDKAGTPLPGVTILVKGTTIGIVSDNDGRYELRLPDNVQPTLVFSFIGMKTQEIAAAGKTEINVTMVEDVAQMEEVVVTGYQTISKERATGAYAIVNAKELEQKPTANISSALNGLVPGLVTTSSPVEGTTRFVIRGQGTLQSDQSEMDPLIVVDGFPISGYSGGSDPFATINPNDVESVTVLKDAAATSIYGARAANGVIVITTKKGKAGNKLDISADAYWSVSSRADLDYLFNMASAESQFRFVELMHKYKPIVLTGDKDPYISPGAHRTYMSAPYRMLFERDGKGNLSAAEYEAEKARLIELGNRGLWKDDLNDHVFRHALRSQYNVALRGMTDRVNYSFSASYDDEKGYAKGNDNRRMTLNMATSVKLTRNLTFDAAVNSSFSKRQNNATDLSNLKNYLSPWTRLVDDNGSYTHVPTSQTIYEPILESIYAGKTPADWHYNPVEDRKYMDNEDKTMNYRVQGGFNYATTWGLNVSAKGQYEWRRYAAHRESDLESFTVRDNYNTYSAFKNGRYESYFAQGGIFTDEGHIYEAYNLRGQADYTLDKDKHTLTVLVGTEILSSSLENTPSNTRYGYNKNTYSVLTAPDYVSDVTNIFNEKVKSPYTPLGVLSSREDRFFSIYANASYTFDERYSITGSFRTDASNFQSESQRDKFSPFWSVGAGWLASKESFLVDVNAIDLLKLRASVGVAGIAAGKSYTSSVTTVAVNPGSPQYSNNEAYNTIGTIGNPSLTWEKSRTFNIGVDGAFFGNKLTGSIEYYNKFSYDVLSAATVPSILQGVRRATFNNAEVVNRGVEFSIGSSLRIVDDLKWQGTLNYAYNHNEVKKYQLTSQWKPFDNHGYVEGMPVDFITVMKPVGYTPEGYIQLQGKDGQVVAATDAKTIHLTDQIARGNGETLDDNNWAYYLGTGTPKSNLSFSNRFSWKGLSLSFMITGRFGYYVPRGDRFDTRANNASYSKQLEKAFAVYDQGYANQTGYSVFPLYNDDNAYIFNSIYEIDLFNAAGYFQNGYMKGDHIRLNEVYLGYDLPNTLLDKQKVFSRINVYAQAANLGLIWSKNGEMDPDYPLGNIKPMPTFTFGLKVSFKNW